MHNRLENLQPSPNRKKHIRSGRLLLTSIPDEDNYDYSKNFESKSEVQDLVKKINKSVVRRIASIGSEIKHYYYIQEKQLSDVNDLNHKFKLGFESLSSIKTAITEGQGNKKIKELINEHLSNLNISISNKHLLSIQKKADYLQFLKSKINEETINSSKWAEELSEVIKYLNDSHVWYNFLNNLYNTLSTYGIQKDIYRYSQITTDLKNNIESEENEGERITNSLKQFIDQVLGQDSEKEYNNIKNIKLDKLKLTSLNKLLDLTLKYKVSSSCDDKSQRLEVKGQYVKLSDVVNESCSHPKSIEIYAINKVFIDADLDKIGDQVKLSIISPTWEIIGNRKIVLDGKSGDAHNPEKAQVGRVAGDVGSAGKAGKPGGSAGHFLGIGKSIINGQNLSISANGGKGGPGQHGGDGAPGKGGLNPIVPEFGDTITCSRYLCDRYKERYHLSEFNCENHETCERTTTFGILGPEYRLICTYLLTGTLGETGGNGGKGGVSGKGGNAGKIMLEQLNGNSEVTKINKPGESGKNGIGGSGGFGGSNGRKRKITCDGVRERIELNEELESGKATPGKKGSDGANSEELKDPEGVPLIQPSLVVNKYKIYARENLKSSIMQSSLRTFLNQFENDKKITGLYDTLGLVEDLRGLEDNFHKLRKEISLLPFYKSLLRRISEYAENEKNKSPNKELTLENKKVLSYLYTATLSKICSINNNIEDDLVIDLKKYLRVILQDIKKFKKIKNVVLTDTYKKEFLEVIATRSKEANSYIETQVTPEINDIINEIENQIVLLVNKTSELQDGSKEKEQQLIKEQQSLKNALLQRQFLGIIKIASQFLGFIGPVGASAGAVVGGGIMAYESLVLDNESSAGTGKITALPGAVKNSVTKITDQLKNKQQLFKEQLKDIDTKLEEFSIEESSGSIDNIKEKLKTTKQQLDEEMRKGASLDPASFDRMYTLREEMKTLLENEKKELEKKKDRNDETTEKKLRAVNYIQGLVGIGEMSVEFYGKIRNHQAKIEKLGEAINDASNEYYKWAGYEKDIYNIIMPTCRNLENTAKSLETKLKNQSHAALDIHKWKIQSTVKDIKLKMRIMTDGFEMQQNFIHYIEKLEEGMSIMINLYDRMEYYHDKSELATYITNIISKDAENIKINDVEMNDAVNSLNFVIKSNLILERYEVAVNAFKQHIFPFAEEFLNEFNLPPNLKSNDSDALLANAIDQIEKLQSKLLVSEATTREYDKDVAKNIKFDNVNNDTPPFVVWKNATNSDLISNLLEGKEITIKADIAQGLHLNAIKFNEIGINFKLKNKTKQRELDKKLQHFKLSMTHLGNSYYRCDDKFYMISNKNQTISYHLSKDNKGQLTHTFLDYDKIKRNEAVLSPYAMWKIKLTNFEQSSVTLAQYKNDVTDLELIGRGQYANEGLEVCNDNLNNYYTLYDAAFDINNIDIYNQENLQDGKENNHRVRRSLSKDNSIENASENQFASPEIDNKKGSSFMENVLHFIHNTSTAFENLNPLNRITKWLNNDQNHIDQEVLNKVQNNNSMIKELFNVESFRKEISKVLNISNNFENNENYNTLNNIVNNSLLNNASNLLLLDLLIRHKTGIKYNQTANINLNDQSNLEHAQKLAYQEQIPTQGKLLSENNENPIQK